MSAPNIVLIIFDDMTVEQLQRMPNLMKLASKGVTFSNAFANTALCQPARVTILSGQYSHNHRIFDNQILASALDHTTMLPARLQAAGYNTSHIGKYFNSWDNTVIPTGWNDWHHTSAVGYYNYPANDNGSISSRGTNLADYQTTVCQGFATSFIASTTQPFFMQVAFKAPHFETPSVDWLNADPAPSYTGVVNTNKLAPRNPNFNVNMGANPPFYMQHDAMDASKINEVDVFYRGSSEALFSADQAVAAINAALITAGKTNTVFIVVSDNGYFRGEGRNPAQKVAPYLPDLKIPMIISGPSNLVAQGSQCNSLVSHIDITPTIYALTGATPTTRTPDGLSLTSLMLAPGNKLRNYLLLEFEGPNPGDGTTGWGNQVPICSSLVSSNFLYTHYTTGELELFDTLHDPFELTNQVGKPTYASVQSDMETKLTALKSCTGANCTI